MFGYGEFGYHKKFHTCFFKAYDHESWMYGTIFCCVLGVFPAVMASSFFYGKILLKLHRNERHLQRHYKTPIAAMVQQLTVDQADSNSLPTRDDKSERHVYEDCSSSVGDKPALNQTNNNALQLRQNAQQRRRVLMLLTIFVIIVICWLPISVSFICDRQNRLPSTVDFCFVVLAWMNSCINIFIYAAMNVQFRKGYKSLLMRPCMGMTAAETFVTATESSASMASDMGISMDTSTDN